MVEVGVLRGGKIVTTDTISAIRDGSEDVLRKLYFHTDDKIQQILIEIIFKTKGWTLVLEDPKEYA